MCDNVVSLCRVAFDECELLCGARDRLRGRELIRGDDADRARAPVGAAQINHASTAVIRPSLLAACGFKWADIEPNVFYFGLRRAGDDLKAWHCEPADDAARQGRG
jgi:hypothetical protein